MIGNTSISSTVLRLNTTPSYYSTSSDPLEIMNDDLSVKNWINASTPNNKREIMRKFGNMLTKEYNNEEKIVINTIEEIPQLSTNIHNHSVIFNSLRLNYEIDNYDYSDFNEFKCSEYFQVKFILSEFNFL